MNSSRMLLVLAVAAPLVGGCSDDDSFCRAVSDLAEVRRSGELSMSMTEGGNAEAAARATERELRRVTADAAEVLDRLEATAPAEVESDVEAVAEWDRKYVEALRQSDFDFLAVSAAVPSFGPRPAEAEARVSSYTNEECGAAFRSLTAAGGGSPDGATDTTTVTITVPPLPTAPAAPTDEPTTPTEAPVRDDPPPESPPAPVEPDEPGTPPG